VVHREATAHWTELDWTRSAGPDPSDPDGVHTGPDGTGPAGNGAERRLEELARAERARGFDMGEPPLVRVVVVRLADGRFRLLWTFHHLLLDGWSLAALLGELAASYRGEAALPRRRPFRDYVAWLQRRDCEPDERYWRERLRGFAEPTPLRVERHLAHGRVESYGEHETALPAAETVALSGLARSHGVTLNTVVEGAWALLLSRYSGRDDVVFGVTTSGRSAPLRGVESMLGMFINAVPARVRVPRDRRAWPWLAGVGRDQEPRQEHDTLPLVRIQECSELPRGTALFDSALVFENYPLAQAFGDWGGSLTVDDVRYRGGRANHPLTVFVLPGADVTVRAVFDAARLDAAAVRRMLDHLVAILAAFAAGTGDGPVLGEVDLLGPDERRRLLAGDSTPDFPTGPPVWSLLAAQARRTPGAPAAVRGGLTLTYSELHRRAQALANVIGGRRNDR
jgi:Condensation domain